MTLKILIVEDSKVDERILRHRLMQAGFEQLVSVTSGEDGMSVMKTEVPDVAIVDTHLPGMDGFETCRRMKTLNARVKVVIVTGEIDAVDARRARQNGADEYCAKTMDQEQVLNAIKNMI